MKTVLIISSQVAASCVGATASAFCLQRLGHNTIVLPTTLLGRHPGWGLPGGGPIGAEALEGMWARIGEQDIHIDAVMTGYMASSAHVELCLTILQELKKTNPQLTCLVDPVMGDHGQLYIKPDIAQAIKHKLIPIADYITPNLWELGYLTQHTDTSTPISNTMSHNEIIRLCDQISSKALVTSVAHDDHIGALLCGNDHSPFAVSHTRFAQVPHGGGDALSATFLAHILHGLSAQNAMAKAVSAIYNILKLAHADGLKELPLIAGQDYLSDSIALPLSSAPFQE